MEKRPVFFILTCFLSLGAFATAAPALARMDRIPGSRYTSTRGAGMGDAGIAVGEDIGSGLFYNPANLARVRGFVFEPINVSGYLNTNSLGVLGTGLSNVTSLSASAPSLMSNPGKSIGAGGAFLPAFGTSLISFGVLVQTEMGAVGADDGTITSKSLYQLIPAFGMGYRFFNGIIRVGYSLQWVNEAVGMNTSSDPTSYSSGLAQGSGLSSNAGLALVIPWSFLPTFNVVFRDIGDTHYRSYSLLSSFAQNSSGVPPDEAMTIDASLSIHPSIGHGGNWSLVFELRDLNHLAHLSANPNGPRLSHIAMGTEFNFSNRFFLRGGVRGASLSGGFGLKRPGTELSFAYYWENQLDKNNLSTSEPRVMFQYQIRFATK